MQDAPLLPGKVRIKRQAKESGSNALFVIESNTSSTEPPLLANWAEEKEGGGGSDEDATTVIEFPLVYDTLYSLEAFPDKITLKAIVPG